MEQSLDINYPHPKDMIELSPKRIAFLASRGLLGDQIKTPYETEEEKKRYADHQAWCLANPEDAAKLSPIRIWLSKDHPLPTIPLAS